MNDKIGPTDNDLLNYLSWCEAQGIPPFDDETEETNTNEIEENDKVENINILIKKRKDD